MADAPNTIQTLLRHSGLDPVDARVLLQHVLGVNHAYLIAHGERTLTYGESNAVQQVFERRSAGEPVAYIVGSREFFGRDFGVTPAVLIPRPDTELLVELALQKLAGKAAPTVLDLGTGSGCIAVTLALEREDASIVAVDLSDQACAVAAANARRLGAENVHVAPGRWFEPVGAATFDLIVSNPPYVAADDPHLLQGDLRFEPASALVGGSSGLADIEVIVGETGVHLRPGGWLLIEHGWDQAEAVARLLARAGLEETMLAHDLAGQPRVSGARR